MVSYYKSLLAAYYSVGAVCIILGYFYLLRHPKGYASYFITLIAVMSFTLVFLSKAAKRRFQKEVSSHLENCRAGLYLEELTKVMGRKRSKHHRSLYACLSSVGYDVLGDYDSLYACCQNITMRSHMPLYHRRMFTYYLSRNELDYAKDAVTALSALADKEKNQAEKKIIQDYVQECERALRVRMGEYDEALKYYAEMIKSTDQHPLITRVSWACVYGEILVKTGNKQAAEEPLLFASSRGGDTKYKAIADKLLAEIGNAP